MNSTIGGTLGGNLPGGKTMTTPKAKLAGLALIAVLCGGFTLGLTAPCYDQVHA